MRLPFYGPKLDIQYKNVFGKEDTLVTIQIRHAPGQRFWHGVLWTPGRPEEDPLSSTAPPWAATSVPGLP